MHSETGEKDTYADLLQRCIRTALHLNTLSLKEGETVCLCTNNHLNASVPFFATQFLGLQTTQLDPNVTKTDICQLLRKIKPKVFFVIPECVETFEKVIEELNLKNSTLVVFGKSDKHLEFTRFLQPHPKEDIFEPIKIDVTKTAVIFFTSGSTGLPKAICMSHRAIIGNIYTGWIIENLDEEYLKRSQSNTTLPVTLLCFSNMSWISCFIITLNSVLLGFCTLVCPKYDPNNMWTLIQKFRPHFLMLIPIMALEWLKSERPEKIDLKGLQCLRISGLPASGDLILALREMLPGVEVYQTYGQTELCSLATSFKDLDCKHRALFNKNPGSSGLPIRGFSYKVVDLDTEKPVGPYDWGELRIKAKYCMMNGYLDDSAATKDAFDSDGWFKTGDIVYFDKDFCFFVVDRIKDVFKYKNVLISPVILQHVILKHPDVREAVVIGVPRDDGHHPMALVVIDKQSDVTEEEIERFVEKHVKENYRLRAGVKFVKEIPYLSNAKINKKAIYEAVGIPRYL